MVLTLKVRVDGNKNSGTNLSDPTKFRRKFNEISRYGNIIDAIGCENIDPKDRFQIFTSRIVYSRW